MQFINLTDGAPRYCRIPAPHFANRQLFKWISDIISSFFRSVLTHFLLTRRALRSTPAAISWAAFMCHTKRHELRCDFECSLAGEISIRGFGKHMRNTPQIRKLREGHRHDALSPHQTQPTNQPPRCVVWHNSRQFALCVFAVCLGAYV